ncbi:MAG: hypothetical protein HYX78_09265 [Armatimonadetes bacterium]|nr:hypothetical protein [Armatimonadota bacterium]
MRAFRALIFLLGLSLLVLSSVPSLAEAAETDNSRGIETVVKYRLDSRYMSQNEGESGLELMALEAEITAAIGDKIDAAVQVPLGSGMTGRGRGMHFGNAYFVFKGKIGKPTVKVGQFVVPFGNLPYYETHTRILQTLYPYSLGIRIDPGIEIEGFLDKDTEFQLAVTQGNGPFRGDIDGNKVLMARVSRQLQIGDDDVRIGLSALKGRLPVFSVMADPLMEGRGAKLVQIGTGMLVEQDDPEGFADKTRYAVDFEWYKGIDLIRGELVFGNDQGRSANGQWLLFEHPLSYKTSVVAQLARWKQFSGDWKGWAVGLEHKLRDDRIARVAFEQRRANEMGMGMTMNMLTAQYIIEF